MLPNAPLKSNVCYTAGAREFQSAGPARGAPSQAEHRNLATGPNMCLWMVPNSTFLCFQFIN